MITRPVTLTGLGGAALAAIGVIGIAAGSEPHLSTDRIDPWLLVFAVGLGVVLAAAAFGLHDRASLRTEDPENRWERALSAWGVIVFAAGVAFALIGATAAFDPATAAGAIALVGLFETAMVVIALLALVLGT